MIDVSRSLTQHKPGSQALDARLQLDQATWLSKIHVARCFQDADAHQSIEQQHRAVAVQLWIMHIGSIYHALSYQTSSHVTMHGL